MIVLTKLINSAHEIISKKTITNYSTIKKNF